MASQVSRTAPRYSPKIHPTSLDGFDCRTWPRGFSLERSSKSYTAALARLSTMAVLDGFNLVHSALYSYIVLLLPKHGSRCCDTLHVEKIPQRKKAKPGRASILPPLSPSPRQFSPENGVSVGRRSAMGRSGTPVPRQGTQASWRSVPDAYPRS